MSRSDVVVDEDSRGKVKRLAMLGCTTQEISYIMCYSLDQIRYHFETELNEGRGDLRSSLRKAQIQTAVADRNPTMLIWLGKQYLNQREPKQELEHSGAITVEKVMFGADEK